MNGACQLHEMPLLLRDLGKKISPWLSQNEFQEQAGSQPGGSKKQFRNGLPDVSAPAAQKKGMSCSGRPPQHA
jgi:hypothetical protein